MQAISGEIQFEMARKQDSDPDDAFPLTRTASVVGFTPPILNPVALLTGFVVEYEPDQHGEGRPLGLLDVRLQVESVEDDNTDTVIVRATFGVRDQTGDWDDEHRGTVRFVVLAD